MPPLNEQVVLVTGASSGIGAAVVRRLVGAGARVALAARREERLNALCSEIDPTGTRTLALAGDVTNAADRQRWVDAALARFGRIDALVNNAGYGQRGPVERVPLEAIRANFETNLFALIGLTQLVAPHLRAQGSGRIINIGSVAGRIARPLSSVYDSTKHALEAISAGLRGELAPFGVQVVVIRPGFIATEFADTADHVSAAALAEAGDYAPYVASFPRASQRLRRVAGSPDDIARVVERALRSARPCAHYAAPFHAKVFLFLKWLLPARAVDGLVKMRR